MKKLSDISDYVKERIGSDEISLNDYVTTDNILQNKCGRTVAENLPPSRCNLTKYKKGDVLVANIRPYLKKIWYADSDGGASADVLVFRAKENVSSAFLYSILLQDSFYDYVMKAPKGSKMPRGDQNHIMRFTVLDTDLPEQKRIAKVLTDIDSKIALNKKINKELETMAKELYDYWFVQFDFPRSVSGEPCLHELSRTDDGNARSDFPGADGKPYKSSGGKMVYNPILKREIPEGWEVKKLGEVLTIKNGKDHKNLTKGNYPVYGTGGIMRYVDKYIYSGESILLPRKGSLDNLLYVNDTFWTIDTIFYSEIKLKKGAKYLFYYIEDSNYKKLESGTGRPSMTSSAYYSIDVLIPDEKTLEQFNKIISVIEKKKSLVMKENARLQQLRDELLPMLMNGQVRVEE